MFRDGSLLWELSCFIGMRNKTQAGSTSSKLHLERPKLLLAASASGGVVALQVNMSIAGFGSAGGARKEVIHHNPVPTMDSTMYVSYRYCVILYAYILYM